MCLGEWFSSVFPAGWLSPGQPPSAGLLRQRPLRLWEHPQGLRLQTAFQVPRLLLPIRERIHVWAVPMLSTTLLWCCILGVGGLNEVSSCPQVDGGHPQRHTQLQRRSRPEQQRISPSLSWIRWSRAPSLWTLCFSFSTHMWEICTCGHAHMVLFLTLYWWHVRWFRLHQRLHFWLFLLSTLKPLFKDIIFYSFLMVSAPTTVSGFTFCHWLYLTAAPCWGPAFCPRWFSFHHIVKTFFEFTTRWFYWKLLL